MQRIHTLSVILAGLMLAQIADAMSIQERRDYLDWMQKNLLV